MAGEIQVRYTTGKLVYVLLRNAKAKIWNGKSFETYAGDSYVTYQKYPINLTEQAGASKYYVGDMPKVPAGVYYLQCLENTQQAPGSVASDLDTDFGGDIILWDGAQFTFVTNSITGEPVGAI